jgi:hypothetical protein
MSEDDDHYGAQVFHCVFETAYASGVRTVSGDTNNEEFAEPLIEDDLRRNSAVGTA